MILKYGYIIAFFLLISCKSTMHNKTELPMTPKEMITDGYNKGVIIASKKEGDCPYVIKIEDDNSTNYLDPVDLPDDFKKDGINIWFKYTPSRRPKRCEKADPVTLDDTTYLRD
jgi:hypothetical protein